MNELAQSVEQIDYWDVENPLPWLGKYRDSRAPLRLVVAIPVHNEEERIADCLQAIGAQDYGTAGEFGILLHLNNCTDRSEQIARAISRMLPCPVQFLIQNFDGANAGWARRCAMDAAVHWLAEAGAPHGVILTTDADSRVPPNWVRSNLGHIDAGADAVAGRIIFDEIETAALPAALRARGALESAYEALLIELDATLDPQEHDPWPCHWTRSGATLAVRRETYLRVGGLPSIPAGEDRAFVNLLLARHARVRHAPDIVVVTSGRLAGRATGGAADTMRARCDNPDELCDERLEPVWRVIVRSLIRRQCLRCDRKGRFGDPLFWMKYLAGFNTQTRSLHDSSVRICDPQIDATNAFLTYRPLRPAQLPLNIKIAKIGLKLLKAWKRGWREEYPAGNRVCELAPECAQTKMHAG